MEGAFNKSSNKLITIRESHFLIVNSMTMARDGCYFCENAEIDLLEIAAQLNCAKKKSEHACRYVTKKLPFYSRPILLQHFPTYRQSDVACIEHDAPEIEMYRENWEVLSKNATEFLAKNLNPSVAFSGHSHHYCRTKTIWNTEEYTAASFSWRNKNSPSFFLVCSFGLSSYFDNLYMDFIFQAAFEGSKYAVTKCDMPVETTVISIYIAAAILYLTYSITIFVLRCNRRNKRRKVL